MRLIQLIPVLHVSTDRLDITQGVDSDTTKPVQWLPGVTGSDPFLFAAPYLCVPAPSAAPALLLIRAYGELDRPAKCTTLLLKQGLGPFVSLFEKKILKPLFI